MATVRKYRDPWVADFRDLRHSFASNLLGAGVDIVTVSKALGHANVHITLTTYAHVQGTSRREPPNGRAHGAEWKQFGNRALGDQCRQSVAGFTSC